MTHFSPIFSGKITGIIRYSILLLISNHMCLPLRDNLYLYLCTGSALLVTDAFIQFITIHSDVISMEMFPHNCPFVRGIHRWQVVCLTNGQNCRALDSSLLEYFLCCWYHAHEVPSDKHRPIHNSIYFTHSHFIEIIHRAYLNSPFVTCLPCANNSRLEHYRHVPTWRASSSNVVTSQYYSYPAVLLL